jgi:transcriptional regulator with XRE-family HTH domain
VWTGRKNGPLGDFLRARRALVDPREVGLDDTERRRVIGLRRDELAQLANISVHYYTRLEQGKHAAASLSVLDSLATALLLPPAERAYLHRLAGVEGVGREVAVRPETVRLMDALGTTPGFVLGPNMDILATNAAAELLYRDDDQEKPDNMIQWLLFRRAATRLFGEDRIEIAAELIGMLRLHAGRKPAHSGIGRVVGELTYRSAFFRKMWAENAVSIGGRRLERVHRRDSGTAERIAETLAVKLAEDQTVLVFLLSNESISAVQFSPSTD